jgi:hypothetical protein
MDQLFSTLVTWAYQDATTTIGYIFGALILGAGFLSWLDSRLQDSRR